MRGVIITVANSKGGTGKTLLAVHLAAWLERRGSQVALVDADAQGSSGAWAAEALPDVPCEAIHDARGLARRLPELAEAFEAVIVDGPAGLAEQTRALLLVGDLAVIPVCPSVGDLRAARLAVDVLTDARAVRRDGKPGALLVLNRYQGHTRLSRECLEAAATLGVPVAKQPVRQLQAYADAVGQGQTVFTMGAAADGAADDLRRLFPEVIAWQSDERQRTR